MSLESITNGRAEDLLAAINSLDVIAIADDKLLELLKDYIGTAIRQDRLECSQSDMVRVVRILEYVGPRRLVEDQISRAIHGTKILPVRAAFEDGTVLVAEGVTIEVTATTLGEFPEILKRTEPSPYKPFVSPASAIPVSERKEESLVDRSKRTMWPENDKPKPPTNK